MTKQYLKMADVFPSDVESCQISGWKHQVRYVPLKTIQQYAAHAINSHDDLVQQNEDMKLRINELLAERNATGVAIDNAISGRLPEHHPMLNRLQMISNLANKHRYIYDRSIADMVNCVRGVVISTPPGAQCLRERISRVIVQSLNGGEA